MTAPQPSGVPFQYVCPVCALTSRTTERCSICGTAVVVEPTAPPPPEPAPTPPGVVAGYVVLTVVTLVALTVAQVLSPDFNTFFSYVQGIAVVVTFVGLLVARRARRLRHEEQARRELAETAVAAIRTARDGRVHLRGRLRTVASPTVAHPRRVLFDALDPRANGGWPSEAQAAGAVFELDDGTDARAVARAAHVRFDGLEPLPGGGYELSDGAEVEVAAWARWLVDNREGALGGLRDAPRILELYSTTDAPAVIRPVGPTATATQVRAAPAAADALMDAHDEAAARRGARRG